MKKQPADIPQEGGNVYPGVVGGQTTSTNPYWGEVEVKFSQFGTETDSYYNSANTWSIQLNTNEWYTPDNHKHWAQFVEQNHPGGNLRYCIWQFDYTSGSPLPKCVPIPQQNLGSTFDGFVTGDVLSSSSLEGTYCNVVSSQCWLAVDTNYYNLGSYWTQTSGTILGEGNSSTAVFATSPNVETTTVQAQSESGANTFNSLDTGEFNNLYYSAGTSTTCSSGTCTTTSSSYN
ncbi:MAG: hypothetical protein KGI09_08230 [Thaumarchaeota archaeon]|nr:hypothetical protein [Nitrososphaerota archaeon]